MRELRVEYARAGRWSRHNDARSLLLRPEEGRKIDELCARARAESGVRVTFSDVARALLEDALSRITDGTKITVEKP